MAEIRHFPAHTDAQTLATALAQDGAIILDEVVSKDFVADLRAETDPYMNATDNGRDEFMKIVKLYYFTLMLLIFQNM